MLYVTPCTCAVVQGGGTPIDSVLRAATTVKILTDKIFISITLIVRLWVLLLKIRLTLDRIIYYIKEI